MGDRVGYEQELDAYQSRINQVKESNLLQQIKGANPEDYTKLLVAELGLPVSTELLKEGVGKVWKNNATVNNIKSRVNDYVDGLKSRVQGTLESWKNTLSTRASAKLQELQGRLSDQVSSWRESATGAAREKLDGFQSRLDELKGEVQGRYQAAVEQVDRLKGATEEGARAKLAEAQDRLAAVKSEYQTKLDGLKSQAEDFATSAKAQAADRVDGLQAEARARGQSLSDRIGSARDQASERVQGLQSQASERASQLQSDLSQRSAGLTDQLRERQQLLSDRATGLSDQLSSKVGGLTGDAESSLGSAAAEEAGSSILSRAGTLGKGLAGDLAGDLVGFTPFIGLDIAQGDSFARTAQDTGVGLGFNQALKGSLGAGKSIFSKVQSYFSKPAQSVGDSTDAGGVDDLGGDLMEQHFNRLRSEVVQRDSTVDDLGGDLMEQNFQSLSSGRVPVSEALQRSVIPNPSLAQEPAAPSEAAEADRVVQEATGRVDQISKATGLSGQEATEAETIGATQTQAGRLLNESGDALEADGTVEAAETGAEAADAAAGVEGGLETAAEVAAETAGETGGFGLLAAGALGLGGVLYDLFGGDDHPKPAPIIPLPNLPVPVYQPGLGG